MPGIHFFQDHISFRFPHISKTKTWLHEAALSRKSTISDLNYIFTDDQHLQVLNYRFLKHDELTDILTFERSENPNLIEGDIYISYERVRENSKTYRQPLSDELHRVMIHGLLHLLGLGDGSPAEKEQMRKLENHYLALRSW